MSIKYLGYIRVSTEDQGDSGLSLESQKKAINQYCELYQLSLGDIISDIASAKSLNRVGISNVIDLLLQNEYQGLIIHKLDRLSRNILDFGWLIENVFSSRDLIAIDNHIDTRSASGRLSLNILISVAQWEREAIAERTKSALNQKRQRGEYLGKVPYGFELVEGKLIPNREQQLIITEIRRKRGYKWSFEKIANFLNHKGYLSPNLKKWNKQTVSNILSRKKVTESPETIATLENILTPGVGQKLENLILTS